MAKIVAAAGTRVGSSSALAPSASADEAPEAEAVTGTVEVPLFVAGWAVLAVSALGAAVLADSAKASESE